MTESHDKGHGHGHGGDHSGFAHVLPVWLLVGVWVALMVFTVLTVVVAKQHLGSQLSFTVAMTIATIKAGLVMAIFMHLWWDKRVNLFTFLGSFLFVLLFIGMLLTDKSEYSPDIKRKLDADAEQAGPATAAPAAAPAHGAAPAPAAPAHGH